MSISPFQPDDRPLQNWQSAKNLQKDDAKKSGPMTLSEALTITAGLAGLIGLLSGVVIRFSLSNSSNARFLSPLQTFPALSDWAPELPQETADSHYLPAGTQRDTWEGSSDALLPNEADPSRQADFSDADLGDADFDSSDFDTFANRGEDGRSYSDSDPWEILRNGPRLSETEAVPSSASDDPAEFEDDYAAPYTEDTYIDDPYADQYEDPYEEPYEESGYENYFDERNTEPFIDAAD